MSWPKTLGELYTFWRKPECYVAVTSKNRQAMQEDQRIGAKPKPQRNAAHNGPKPKRRTTPAGEFPYFTFMHLRQRMRDRHCGIESPHPHVGKRPGQRGYRGTRAQAPAHEIRGNNGGLVPVHPAHVPSAHHNAAVHHGGTPSRGGRELLNVNNHEPNYNTLMNGFNLFEQIEAMNGNKNKANKNKAATHNQLGNMNSFNRHEVTEANLNKSRRILEHLENNMRITNASNKNKAAKNKAAKHKAAKNKANKNKPNKNNTARHRNEMQKLRKALQNNNINDPELHALLYPNHQRRNNNGNALLNRALQNMSSEELERLMGHMSD